MYGLSSKLKRLLRNGTFIAGILILTGMGGYLKTQPVNALDADSYSWPNAPCEFGSNGGPSCKNPDQTDYPGDAYDWYENNGNTFSGSLCWYNTNSECFDPTWKFQYRNCTDYVAEKIFQQFNVNITSRWGEAKNWLSYNANVAHYPTDPVSAPQIGDIAVWTGGTYGHVAYVAAINGGTVTYDEYNYARTGSFSNSYTNINHGNPDGYIHIGTVTPTPLPSPSTYMPSSAVIDFNGNENIFARGIDNQAYINSWGGASWSGFSPLANGGGAVFAGNPTAINYNNQGKAFARGTNNEIYESTWDGSTNSWGTFGALQSGATFNSDPVAVQYGNDLDLFAIGTDKQMYEITKSPDWGTFSLVQSGAYFVGNPRAITYNNNEYVIARGTDNQMYVDTWVPGSGWSGFNNLDPGATFAGDPAVYPINGVLNVFARGTDNQMYVNWLDTGWHPFSVIPGGAVFAGDPSVAQFNGQEKVFARGTNNEIYEDTWNGSSWTGFGSLQSGATFQGNPVAINYGNVLNVFARGTDNQMYEITKDPDWGIFVLVQNGALFSGFSWQ